jgi:hypothetical protein
MKHYVRDWDVGLFATPVVMLYGGVLSILIGSLASAEERQLGTLEWQLVLPMAAWQQWAVKAGVTLGLAATLGVGLPAAFAWLTPTSAYPRSSGMWHETVAAVLLLTTCSLYVSSLCTGGVRAMVFSLSLILAMPYVTHRVTLIFWRAFQGLGVWMPLMIGVGLPILTGFAALALCFAQTNHRLADRSVTRVLRHGLWILAYVTLVVALATFA